ncbi:MAG: hypothetical protein Q8914_02110 [Bacteroidota bacterium]|nr:hypothetical protein [Bacteroidota bacterium]
MKKESLYHTLDYAIRKALDKLKERESSAAVVDLYLFPNPESADFTILDDEDNVLVKLSVPAWEEQFQGFDSDEALKECEPLLKEIVFKVKDEGLFEQQNIIKPFSVLLVDEEMEVVAELLTLDDEQLLLNDDFLKHMDDELDGFYKQLMSDM